MLLVKSSVRPSPIHGMGCFAEQDIQKGERVWRFDPILDPAIDEESLNQYPRTIQEFVRFYAYVQKEGARRVYILCGDHARQMNHSDSPNLLPSPDAGASTFIAAWDIKAGEELTCNYRDFDLDADVKLSSPVSQSVW